MPHAVNLANAMKLNIPIKEEMGDDLDLWSRSPYGNGQDGANEHGHNIVDNNITSLSRENGSEMESEEGEEEKADIIFSLRDSYYKAALKEHYEAVAKMKREGMDHDINERVDRCIDEAI